MAFSENMKRICAERGTTLTAVVRKIKHSSSYVTAINNGSIPKEADLLAFAQELNCSVMDFFVDEGDVNMVEPLDEDETDIIRIYRSLSRRSKHEFMSLVYEFEKKDTIG